MQKTQFRSPGREDPFEKEMTTHSSILAWEISWTEEPVGYRSQGHKELDTTEVSNTTQCPFQGCREYLLGRRNGISK